MFLYRQFGCFDKRSQKISMSKTGTMKKRSKASLRNTRLEIEVEYYSARPAGNTQRYRLGLIDRIACSLPSWKKDAMGCIAKVLSFINGHDPYKLCIIRRYVHIKTRRVVKVKRSPLYYVVGRIADKSEVAEYFSFAPNTSRDILALSGERVFWSHFQVEALSESARYGYLEYARVGPAA